MTKEEIKVFASKYFKGFDQDIHYVSYFICNNKVEYLVNNHYILVKELAE